VYAVYMLKETYWGEFDEKKVPKKHITKCSVKKLGIKKMIGIITIKIIAGKLNNQGS
jgi:hypothetical protein